jgi:uncharacterized metal-binding protein YceD (DUF177 family)
MHQELVAGPIQRDQLARAADLPDVLSASASFDLTPLAGDCVQVTGRVTARVVQTCVVTLDPVENEIDEPVDIMFAPASQIPVQAKIATKDEGDDAELPDPPEPILNGVIDLGALAAEYLLLGLDPYPRKPGAEFDPPKEEIDPDEHPFAALKALKAELGDIKSKKPKGH